MADVENVEEMVGTREAAAVATESGGAVATESGEGWRQPGPTATCAAMSDLVDLLLTPHPFA